MRFEKIQLTAYGHFTNKILDFSDPAKSVHVIYGPNEAGKTTLKSAVEELLFGYHGQTKFNFKHSYQNMALGGTIINLSGARISFVRKKRERGSDLFTAANEQMQTTALTPFVGGLTRDVYENQFCLSRASMIAGSTEIANGSGEVGENLYNAALGNTSLSEIITRLEKQRDDLFTPPARNKPLNAALSKFESQRLAARAAVMRPMEWQRVLNDRDGRLEEITTINCRIASAATLTALLTSLRAFYPNYDRLRLARAALVESANEPCMGPAAVDTSTVLLEQIKEAEREIERYNRRLARLVETIGPEQSDSLIAQRAVIEDLKGRVDSYRRARTDLLEKNLMGYARSNAESARRHLDSVWPGLDLAEARKRTVLVDLQTSGNALVLDVVRLNDKCRVAAESERDLLDQMADIDGELSELPVARNFDLLRAAVTAATTELRLDSRIFEVERDASQSAAIATKGLVALGRYRGTLTDFISTILPLAATVDRYISADAALRDREERNAELTEATVQEQASACEQLDAIKRERDIPTLVDLVTARVERDQRFDMLKDGWRAKATVEELDSAASGYVPAVSTADRVADTLRNEADRVARVATLEAQRDAAVTELLRLAQERALIKSDRDGFGRAWEAEWVPLSIAPLPPLEMRAWVLAANEVRRQAAEADVAAGTLEGLVTRRVNLRTAIANELTAIIMAVPSEPAIEPVLGLARQILADADVIEGTRARLEGDKARHQRALLRHQRDSAQANAALRTATQAYDAILTRLQLPAELPAAAFADTLAAIASFHAFDKSARADKSRADGIERDNIAFSNDVVTFIKTSAPDLLELANASPDVAAEQLHIRLVASQTEFDQREARLQQLKTEREALAAETDEHNILMADLSAILANEKITRELLPARLERSRILNTHAQTIAGETEHLESGTGKTLAECDAEYGDRDRAKLDNDLAVIKIETESWTGERSRLEPKLWELNERLRSLDGSSAAADAEAMLATLGAQIDQYTRRWVEIALALHILKEQIREYAEVNQGALITRASHYLNILTNGAYARLRAVNNGKRNMLEIVHQDERGLEIDALSEGTRDQLFLALRLAALEKYLQEGEPQPLILDDTFIAFDDVRTVQAFRALSELAGKTQVFYFTHHDACVEAARAGVPAESLSVHHLNDTVPELVDIMRPQV